MGMTASCTSILNGAKYSEAAHIDMGFHAPAHDDVYEWAVHGNAGSSRQLQTSFWKSVQLVYKDPCRYMYRMVEPSRFFRGAAAAAAMLRNAAGGRRLAKADQEMSAVKEAR